MFIHLDYIIAYPKSNAKLNVKFVPISNCLHYTMLYHVFDKVIV